MLSKRCPLNSVLVVPLHIDKRVIGTIKLYEPRDRRFLNMNKALGEGIADLLSNQLLLTRYEEQKNLLVMADLKLLEAQMNSHFLFNSPNTVISFIRTDADRARDLLIHLSIFFRKNLKRNGEMATLEEELDHINSYLKIKKARFEDRLTIEMDIDPSLLNVKIPAFTLQPLVENAIKHGISGMLGQGITKIGAHREGDLALFEIEDSAGTFCENGAGDGLGIKIVDRRIKILMGEAFGASFSWGPNQMTRVTVKIPAEGF
jgi:two-component system LytT family sensor kinase